MSEVGDGVHFDRKGFAYTIDRANGQVLVAKPYQFVNWSTRVDLATGRPVRVPAEDTHQDVNTRNIGPSRLALEISNPPHTRPGPGFTPHH